MKDAKMLYVSPYQTDSHPLREILKVCEPLGVSLERDPKRGVYYKAVCQGRELTEFSTLKKLAIWIKGFEAGIKINQQN